MYTDRASSKTNCITYKLWYYLHVIWYRISYTRWTPGKFSSLHQRMVTCPWMRQSFSLPQCSVQHFLPLPSTHSPHFPLQNMLPADIFRPKKMVHLVDFLWSFFILIFLTGLMLCHLARKFIYLFSPFFLLKCQNNLNFKGMENHYFNYFFSCFAKIDLCKQISWNRKHNTHFQTYFRNIQNSFVDRNLCYPSYIPFQRKEYWEDSIFTVQIDPYKCNHFQNKVTITRFIVYFSWFFILKPNFDLLHSTHIHCAHEVINLNITGCPSHFLSCTSIQSYHFLN